MQTLTELETPQTTLVPVGYSVNWRLKLSRIYRSDLFDLLTQHGLDKYLPDAPSRYIEVKNALESWARDRRRKGISATKTLVTSDRTPDDYNLFYIVARNLDLGGRVNLDVTIRVRLDKATGDIIFVSNNTEAIEPSQNDVALALDIQPYLNSFHDLYTTHDLAAMLTRILLDMDGINTGHDGTFFVPESSRAALLNLKELVKKLPGLNSRLTALPIQGDDEGREESAGEVHAGFLDEIERLRKELERLADNKPGSVKTATVTKQLGEFQELRQKLGFYSDLLGIRVKDVNKGIDGLDAAAEALIKSNVAAREAKAAPAPTPEPAN